MQIDWARVLNLLIPMVDNQGPAYLSGSRFLTLVREVDPGISVYNDFIEERRIAGKSTTRRDFFRDVLKEMPANLRQRAVYSLLDHVESTDPSLAERSQQIRNSLNSGSAVPRVDIPLSAWSAERLNADLALIDGAISSADYRRALTLSYSTLEGFLGVFIRANSRRDEYPKELVSLAKEARNIIKEKCPEHPSELLNLITPIAFAVGQTRNSFSEAHFGKTADPWFATFVRDLLNSQVRLLLHFVITE